MPLPAQHKLSTTPKRKSVDSVWAAKRKQLDYTHQEADATSSEPTPASLPDTQEVAEEVGIPLKQWPPVTSVPLTQITLCPPSTTVNLIRCLGPTDVWCRGPTSCQASCGEGDWERGLSRGSGSGSKRSGKTSRGCIAGNCCHCGRSCCSRRHRKWGCTTRGRGGCGCGCQEERWIHRRRRPDRWTASGGRRVRSRRHPCPSRECSSTSRLRSWSESGGGLISGSSSLEQAKRRYEQQGRSRYSTDPRGAPDDEI